MKKIIVYTIIGCLFFTGISSCDDFLNVTPLGKTDTPTLFSDISGIRSALPGSYSLIFNYYDGHFYKYPEVAGNMLVLRSSSDMSNQYNFISAQDELGGSVGQIWGKILEALANVNNIIKYQPELLDKYPNHAEELHRIKAEALFLRALCHFDLCRVYAQPYTYTPDASHLGIPVLTKIPSANESISRSPVKDVYQQIIIDLEESIGEFGDIPMRDVYHASKLASMALLSRVYLYMENWEQSANYATKVINEVPLARDEDYLAMYRSTVKGNEIIFRLNGLEKNTGISDFYETSEPEAAPADTLISLFDQAEDIRLRVLTDVKDGVVYNACRKFYIPEKPTTEEDRNNPIVLRSSEMYLNRAEAYVNQDKLKEAAADIKAIIARALQKDISEIVIPENKKDSLKYIIEKERTKELCFEGHQFYDITRRKQNLVRAKNTNSFVKFKSYPDDWFILPIPIRELNANRAMQPNPTVNR